MQIRDRSAVIAVLTETSDGLVESGIGVELARAAWSA
jgi:hypothetical protein